MLCKKHLGNGEPRAGASRIRERYSVQVSSGHRGRSLMVKPLPSKQITRVRFSSPAPLDLSSPHHTQIFLARRVRTATKTADSDFSTGLIAQPGTSHPRFWQAPRCGQSLRFWAVQTDSNAGFCPPVRPYGLPTSVWAAQNGPKPTPHRRTTPWSPFRHV